jgi:hypothetical protein
MTNKGKESNRWASPVRPFDRLTAQGRPFDTTQGRPFDPAQDKLFGKAQQGNGFHRPLGLVNRHSFEARRTQRRVLFSGESGREMAILQKPPGPSAKIQIFGPGAR